MTRPVTVRKERYKQYVLRRRKSNAIEIEEDGRHVISPMPVLKCWQCNLTSRYRMAQAILITLSN